LRKERFPSEAWGRGTKKPRLIGRGFFVLLRRAAPAEEFLHIFLEGDFAQRMEISSDEIGASGIIFVDAQIEEEKFEEV